MALRDNIGFTVPDWASVVATFAEPSEATLVEWLKAVLVDRVRSAKLNAVGEEARKKAVVDFEGTGFG